MDYDNKSFMQEKAEIEYERRTQKRKKSKVFRVGSGIIIAVLICFIFAIGGISLFDTNLEVSEKEQRNLAQFPKFSLESFFDGSFFREFNLAYSDTFPFRSWWLDSYNFMKELITIKGNDAQQLEGNETTTKGDDEETQKTDTELLSLPFDYTGFEQFLDGTEVSNMLVDKDRAYAIFNGNVKGAETFVNAIKTVQSRLPSNRVVSLVVPQACAIYADEKYLKDNHDVNAWLNMVDKNLGGIKNIKVIDNLKAHKDEYIYFRTDHHWTARGAYYAYQVLCKELGLYCYDINLLEEGKIIGFLGSLYSATNSSALKNNPDEIYYYKPIVNVEAKAYENYQSLSAGIQDILLINPNVSNSNKYCCFIDGDNPLTCINTNSPSGKTLVVIKDSYGNVIIPWLCNNYSKIYVIDPRHVNSTADNILKIEDFVKDKDGCDVLFVCLDECAGTINSAYVNGIIRMLK